jgi:hypothetical protein
MPLVRVFEGREEAVDLASERLQWRWECAGRRPHWIVGRRQSLVQARMRKGGKLGLNPGAHLNRHSEL